MIWSVVSQRVNDKTVEFHGICDPKSPGVIQLYDMWIIDQAGSRWLGSLSRLEWCEQKVKQYATES